jgi:hypothetical protein
MQLVFILHGITKNPNLKYAIAVRVKMSKNRKNTSILSGEKDSLQQQFLLNLKCLKPFQATLKSFFAIQKATQKLLVS